MGALILNVPTLVNPNSMRKIGKRIDGQTTFNFQTSLIQKSRIRFSQPRRTFCYSTPPRNEAEDPQNFIQELRVPNHWLEPSKASEESEWLRVTLNKWLDDEYCPEATNIEISNVAARSFKKSLLEKRDDLGEILLKMAVELESISYQDSFHGAFSSANAAVNLIIQRILEK